ncbi:MAG: type IV pilin N-terminal domain-containing protein [Haloarculaceae archaeon]
MHDDHNCDTHARARGVSSVVGVTLMVAIVVLIATLIASFALGFDEKLQEPEPVGHFEKEYVGSGEGNTNDRPYVNIVNDFGDTIDAADVLVKDGSGNTITWADVWTGGPEVHAGDHVHIDGFGSDSVLDPICEEGQAYTVVYQPGDGSTSTLEEWTVPRDPELPSGSPSDTDGDGIPDWC